ncbi:MAG: DUF3303 family protein [Roseovarius sp.]|nr:DUF3303 family protein [Roseovarius sp.]MBQ0811468.1 DUF3303 family protein [Roseovarius sp.]
MRKYMVIERFKEGCCDAVYQRFETSGRLLPEGLSYLNSWTNRDRNICYQLMETRQPDLFDVWVSRWNDLVDFEIIPLD